MITVMVLVRVPYRGAHDVFRTQRATPSLSLLAARDPAWIATFWRPATRATPRPCQPCRPGYRRRAIAAEGGGGRRVLAVRGSRSESRVGPRTSQQSALRLSEEGPVQEGVARQSRSKDPAGCSGARARGVCFYPQRLVYVLLTYGAASLLWCQG